MLTVREVSLAFVVLPSVYETEYSVICTEGIAFLFFFFYLLHVNWDIWYIL